MRSRLGRCYRDFLAPWHYRVSRKEFLGLLPREFSAESLWRLCCEYKGQGWFRDLGAWQVESEYCALLEWVARKHPSVILEIGVGKGATLLGWSRLASRLVISVDMPGGRHGGGYPVAKDRLFQNFVADRPGVELLTCLGNSHSEELRDRVSGKLNGRRIDFLFIDGDHTYDGVVRDFELWSPLVARGGYVGFHDIVPHRELKDCEVHRLWEILKRQYVAFEIVADPDQGWAGVGILQMPVDHLS